MSNRPLKAILVAAALLRVVPLIAAWNAPHQLATPDSAGYSELAQTLVDRGAFERDELPEVFRTPGYPMLLVLGAPFGESGWRVTALLQVALDVLLVYLTFLLGTLACDRRVGLWAAAFQAVAAVAIAASLRPLSDGLSAFVTTLSVLLLVHHFRFGGWWSLLSAAGAAAVGCYVRPVGIVCCAIAVIVLLARKQRFRHAGAFAGIVLVALSPWVVRNVLVADYAGLSSFAGDSLYYFGAPKVIAEARGMDVESIRDQMRTDDRYAQELSLGERTSGQGARDRRGAAMRTIRQHPCLYSRIHLRGCASFFLPATSDLLEIAGITTGQRGTLDVLHEQGLTAAVRRYLGGKTWAIWLCVPFIAILAAKYLLAFVCLVRRLRPGMDAAGWLLLLVFAAFALSGGPASTPRFRAPVEPLFSVAAAIGLTALISAIRRRKGFEHQTG